MSRVEIIEKNEEVPISQIFSTEYFFLSDKIKSFKSLRVIKENENKEELLIFSSELKEYLDEEYKKLIKFIEKEIKYNILIFIYCEDFSCFKMKIKDIKDEKVKIRNSIHLKSKREWFKEIEEEIFNFIKILESKKFDFNMIIFFLEIFLKKIKENYENYIEPKYMKYISYYKYKNWNKYKDYLAFRGMSIKERILIENTYEDIEKRVQYLRK